MNFALHFCPRCGVHTSLTEQLSEVVECSACHFRDSSPSKSLFGRSEWDTSDWTNRLLLCVSPTERKLRLLVCTTARYSFPTCQDSWFLAALACAEEWADAETAPPEAVSLEQRFNSRPGRMEVWAASVIQCLADPIGSVFWWEWPDVYPVAADATRELFAHPFVPLEWNPEWFTSTVRDLAAHIYAERDFSTMPVLGDALLDAGCDHQLIQDHCRTMKPHARGCWLVDAILGKS